MVKGASDMIEVMFFTVLFYKIWIILPNSCLLRIIFWKCQNMLEYAGVIRKMLVAWTLLINAGIFPTLSSHLLRLYSVCVELGRKPMTGFLVMQLT